MMSLCIYLELYWFYFYLVMVLFSSFYFRLCAHLIYFIYLFFFFILHTIKLLFFVLIGLIYLILLDFLSFIFSIINYSNILSLTSENFECGFYPVLNTIIVYRFNYWFVIVYFLIFEQELLLLLLFIFSTISLNSSNILFLLLWVLCIDLIFFYDYLYFDRHLCFKFNYISFF
jgi:hypothetical protein